MNNAKIFCAIAATAIAGQLAAQPTDYIAAIHKKIVSLLVQPCGVNDPKASTILTLKVTAAGNVTLVDLIKSSGITAYDQAIMKAALAADPLPVPDGGRIQFITMKFQARITKACSKNP